MELPAGRTGTSNVTSVVHDLSEFGRSEIAVGWTTMREIQILLIRRGVLQIETPMRARAFLLWVAT